MADNNNTGKILAILGITAGVGVGLYFLLKPKTASAKTNTGLTPSQQAQINAAKLKAQQGGIGGSGTDKAVQDAVKAALAKIAYDKAKDALKPDAKSKSGSGPSGGGSGGGGGGGNDKGNKYDYKGSDYAEGYNYNYGEGEYGGSYENSDYAYGYNDNYEGEYGGSYDAYGDYSYGYDYYYW